MFKIEKEFEYKGYPCYCIMQNHAHRLGYVGVSKSNSLFEKDSPLKYWSADCAIGNCLRVHGGVTYRGHAYNLPYNFDNDKWWFGFDCFHGDDLPDLEAADKYFGNDKEYWEIRKFLVERKNVVSNNAEIRSIEYVEKQIKKLADQLSKYEKEENKWENI